MVSWAEGLTSGRWYQWPAFAEQVPSRTRTGRDGAKVPDAIGCTISLLLSLLTILVFAQSGQSFVVVRQSTAIHARPDVASPQAFIGTGEEMHSFLVLKQTSESDGWVGVETLSRAESSRHCASTGVSMAAINIRLRGFVQRADLVPVVGRLTEQSWPDGTSARLSTGVPLSPRVDPGTGEREVLLDGVSFPLVVPSDAVVLRYTTTGRTARVEDNLNVHSEDALALNEKELHFRPGWRFASTYEPKVPADGGIVTLGTPGCSELKVRWTQHRIASPTSSTSSTSSTGIGGGGCDVGGGPVVRMGASIFWVDGAPAGKTREPWIPGPTRQIENRLCLLSDKTPLCFDRANLTSAAPLP